MFQERNQCSRNRYYLFWRYIHVINFFAVYNYIGVSITSIYFFLCKAAISIQWRVCLSNDKFIFFVSSQIFDFFCYDTGCFIYFTIWRFNETIFIDFRIGTQRVNQTDVWTFRCFNRTHTTIVRRMYISYFEPCAFTAQTARPQCRKSSFMCQFCQRVDLVHKLRQLAGTKEFLDSSNYRTNINQTLRRYIFAVLNGHSFTNYAFHTGQTNTELVLQQFANAANAAVAQMVNIIGCVAFHAVNQVQQVAYSFNNIFTSNYFLRRINIQT